MIASATFRPIIQNTVLYDTYLFWILYQQAVNMIDDACNFRHQYSTGTRYQVGPYHVLGPTSVLRPSTRYHIIPDRPTCEVCRSYGDFLGGAKGYLQVCYQVYVNST